MRKILNNKIYLYLTEFFAGMSVMAVELGASRLLAPYFSSSQIVYTIIIGTVMIAMALGNIYGGRSADKDPNPDKLYTRILIAAIWIAAIPVVGKYIIIGISGLVIFTVNSNFLVIAAFASAMVVFVFPLFLLGTVTPSLAAYTIGSLEDSGKVVGRLGACNTIGSIIGTFIPTFVTIPSVGTAVSFLIFAGILLALSIIYFLSGKVSLKKTVIGVILFAVCCVFGSSDSFAFWEDDLTFEGESIYNYIQVKEGSSTVILSTNVLFGVQSVYQKDEGLTGMYYDYAMAAPLMAGITEKTAQASSADTSSVQASSAEDSSAQTSGTSAGPDSGGSASFSILILGNGSGTFATQCTRYFGDLVIDAVEIDGKITELASEHFHLPDSVNVATYDGRAYLNSIKETYDVIMVDAYQDITVPFQMSSKEFFELVKDHLKPDGVLVVNMSMRGKGENTINSYLSDTIASVFSEVWTADVDWSSNRELYAGSDPEMIEIFRKAYAENAADGQVKMREFSEFMAKVDSQLVRYKAGDRIMTDDKAPVELLSMQAIDGIIYDEVAYFKDIYREKGIKGVIDALQ